eukprot:TRINITY_DN17478_c0_g1_i1.p1 TRINITY_DN17478_c0_g1~~TRINITY_DN17478_c0_g1_i1.p1  ORF type:complete len:416 (-),score=87.86 TRINITY_DN17478_c0_g1_i1:187-1434(-)
MIFGRLLVALCISTSYSLTAVAVQRHDTGSSAGITKLLSSGDFFEPTFIAPQLTPHQFLLISSPVQKKIVYTQLMNFKSSTGRTFALVDSGLVDPRGMSLDRDRGALYVADKGAKKIYRYHIYKKEDPQYGLQLITDGVQLVVADNADTEWVHVDMNGDVFYSDAALRTINRIPSNVVQCLAKGQYSSSDLVLISQKQMQGLSSNASLDEGGQPTSMSNQARMSEEATTDEPPHIFTVYEGKVNPNVGTPAGVVSDGARLFWANAQQGSFFGSVVEGEVDPQVPQGQPFKAFPSKVLTNTTELAYGMAASNKMVFFSTADKGLGSVNGLAQNGAMFSFATGLSAPKGLAWDGDQTMYVADSEASGVYSFPIGRLIDSAPLEKSASLQGAFGVALFGENDKAWNIAPQGSSRLPTI